MTHTRHARGRLIKLFCGARGWSYTRLAEEASVSVAFVSRAARDERIMGEAVTRNVAAALGVKPEYLTGQLPPYRAIREIASPLPFEKFAASIGLTPDELTAIEDGEVAPNEYVVGSIAARLGVYAKDLNPELHADARSVDVDPVA